VRTKLRYIDLDRCNGCGECAQVCPELVSDEFNEGLNQRKAAYNLYPQATPDGLVREFGDCGNIDLHQGVARLFLVSINTIVD